MKVYIKISIVFVILLCVSFSYAQIRVDNNGDTFVGFGTFNPGKDAILFLGDKNHFIKSKFGYGVSIGTGAYDVLRLPEWSGKVGVFKEPSYTLDVDGYVRGAYLSISDEQLKKNISSLSEEFRKISQLSGVSFEFNIPHKEGQKKSELHGKRQFGFIAQKVRSIFPELVHEDDSGLLSVDYISFIPLIVESLNSMNSRIQELESQSGFKKSLRNLDDGREKASLFQMNPTSIKSSIKLECFVPKGSKNAGLYIYDLQGKQLKSFKIYEGGNLSISIKRGSLNSGMYLYSLIIDDVVIDTKKLVLIE